MPGRISESEARAFGHILDTALALPEMFEQFEPMRMSESLRDLGRLANTCCFGPALDISSNLMIIQQND